MQLRQHADDLANKQIAVAVVTFEPAWRAQAYVDQTRLSWPLLVDPDRVLFTAYGMGQGSMREIMGWRSWWAYAKLLVAGRRLRRASGDIYQLGGDVLIDPQGIVRLHYIGRGPFDRPSIAQLLAVVKARTTL